MKIYPKILLISLMVFACQAKVELNSVDTQKWRDDGMGCENYRNLAVKNLYNEKGKLIGLSPSEISDLLGSPNENEIYKRNQRFFVYYTGQGHQCSNENTKEPSSINIRFDAIDRANEVYLIR